ncbi:protein of unknown function [bacterium A37T11]|nr:protein of unknown function [bacterium A37T11]
MTKYFLWAMALFSSSHLAAQDLASHIPADAFAVATIRSNQFFTLMPLAEFDQSEVGKRIIKNISEMAKGPYQSIADLGINLNSASYLFSRMTDSITYYGLMVPLADAAKWDQLYQKSGNVYTKSGDLRSLSLPDKEFSLVWNDHALVILKGSLKSNYFEQKDVASRYGLKNTNYGDYYPSADTSAVANDTTGADTTSADHYYDDYNKKAAQDDSLKTRLTAEWVQKEIITLLYQPNGSSILSNGSFKRSIPKKAVATVWLRNLDEIYKSFVPDIYTAMLGVKKGSFFTGLGSINASLIIDHDKVQIVSEAGVSKELAASYRKMYKRKLNKKFLKYIDSDKAVGMLSLSLNSQAYLEELPKLVHQTYSRLVPVYGHEIDLGALIFSLLLDEKGLGQVVKGDGLMLLNGISEREVTYTDYEYDQDYNSKEVQKKKIEQIPDFLAMFSSDDSRLFEKLLDYGVFRKTVIHADGLYTLPVGKSPFPLHFLIKDKIVFVGTSLQDIQRIQKGQTWGKVSSKDRTVLTKNNMALLLKTSKAPALLSNIPAASASGLDRWKRLAAGMGDFSISTTRFKGNKIGGVFNADVPSSDVNGLKYLIRLVNQW